MPPWVNVFPNLAAGDLTIARSEAGRGQLNPSIGSPFTGQPATRLR